MVQTIRTLGIDLGTNSLGWCFVETIGEPGQTPEGRIVGIGVRIFSQAEMAGRDPQSKTSLAVARREARAMRRRRDRYLSRRSALLRTLTEFGLMPADEVARQKLLASTGDGQYGALDNSVHGLRARALDAPLYAHQIGRVLFQLNQRRGFKSNRKTDRKDNEAGKIAIGVSRLGRAMSETDSRTYGEFLFKRRKDGNSVRTRLRPETGDDSNGEGYDYYPSRAALEAEFDAICEKQAEFHPALLTPERIGLLRDIMFFQRPLKAPKPGKCSYNPAEERMPKAHPLFQSFRLYKEVNELEVIGEDQTSRKLKPDQRDALAMELRSKKSATFSVLRKRLRLPQGTRFNKESENRTKLVGDEVHASLADQSAFGNRWVEFPIERQWEILSRLRNEEDRDVLVNWLVDHCGLHADEARFVADINLPEGYGRLGESALMALLDALKNETDDSGFVITEAEAAIRVYGRTNSEDDPNRGGLDFLPNYQEVLERHIPPGSGDPDDPYDDFKGRITNPTVHIALNQLRRVVNAIIRRHGRPDRIAIELGRELKLNEKQREAINRDIGKNTREAQARSDKLKELGQPDTGYNRMRLKLWEELNPKEPLNRVCVYSGEPISIGMLFSDEVDVDHILPYSRTLDDGQSNRILCKAHANRQKRNRAPADVPEWSSRYDAILTRAGNLPRNKQWRFAVNAMEKFSDEEGFMARQLTDTQYVSRMALSYLAALYPAEEADIQGVLRRHNHVRALPGRMTELLRRKWELNQLLPDHNYSDPVKQKNRLDHRHHAIDAAVIACTSRALIQKLATASAAEEERGTERVIADVEMPWPSFRDELREAIASTVVSHKPDHGTVSRSGLATGKGQTAGKLHNDTAYGLTGEKDNKGNDLVVRRKPIGGFKKPSDLHAIRDRQLRETLWEETRGLSGKEFEQALLRFSRQPKLNGKPNPFRNLRHVRIVEPLQTIHVRDKSGRAYKGYKGDSNHRYDVWRLLDGKWLAEVVSTFDAHQPGWSSNVRLQHPTARKILSLHQNDIIAIDRDGARQLMRVVKFGANGQVTLAALHEAGTLKTRDADESDPFKYNSPTAGGLKKLKARQVRVDELGTVFDPGPRD